MHFLNYAKRKQRSNKKINQDSQVPLIIYQIILQLQIVFELKVHSKANEFGKIHYQLFLQFVLIVLIVFLKNFRQYPILYYLQIFISNLITIQNLKEYDENICQMVLMIQNHLIMKVIQIGVIQSIVISNLLLINF